MKTTINTQKYLPKLFFLTILFSSLLTTSSVEAVKEGKLKSILQENFNSYINGPVVGQEGWFDRANGTSWVVQDVIVKEGIKALYNNNPGTDSVVTKTTGTALADGRQSFYIHTQNRFNWGDDRSHNVQIGLFQGSWDGLSRATLAFTKDGHAAYLDTTIDSYINFDTFLDNSWTLVEVEWRSVDKTVRWRINKGKWTARIPFIGGSYFTGFDTIGFVTWYLGTGGVYIDDLY